MTTTPDFKYDHAQLAQYFDRIALDDEHRLFTVQHLSPSDQLAHLAYLQRHHAVKIPWENLDQHYTHHRTLTIRPVSLFRKIINTPGRGGYCMENNTIVHFLLHSLGFATYLTGSRIFNPASGTFGGWSHCVNIVTIAGTPYFIDIGLGSTGPIEPISLHDPGVVHAQIAPAQCRVVRRPLPGSLSGQDYWMYEWRTHEGAEWVPQHCFAELEFTLPDVQGMNLLPMTSRTTFFTWKVVCVRFTVAGEGDEGVHEPGSATRDMLDPGEIDGTLVIDGEKLKWRRRGKKVLEKTLTSEEERVAALEKYFGIVIPQEDWEAIHGSAAAVGNGAHVLP